MDASFASACGIERAYSIVWAPSDPESTSPSTRGSTATQSSARMRRAAGLWAGTLRRRSAALEKVDEDLMEFEAMASSSAVDIERNLGNEMTQAHIGRRDWRRVALPVVG